MNKIALIGAGRIGQIHARNAVLHPALSLAAVVDPVAEAATRIAETCGCRVATLDEVLSDASIEGVIIASATNTHLDYMLRAAEAGKTIFCEKPVDQDLKRAREAERSLSGANILIGFNRRFDRNFAALKRQLDRGSVGSLETLEIMSNDPAPPPVEYIAVSGGLFKDMAIHDFDKSNNCQKLVADFLFPMNTAT